MCIYTKLREKYKYKAIDLCLWKSFSSVTELNSNLASFIYYNKCFCEISNEDFVEKLIHRCREHNFIGMRVLATTF